LSGLSTLSNISFHTFSSFDADDELSSNSDMTDDDSITAHSQIADELPEDMATRRYPGEDTRPTSKKELAGWYMYGFAAETYIICGA
jgi:UMF1 family MFS transporter